MTDEQFLQHMAQLEMINTSLVWLGGMLAVLLGMMVIKLFWTGWRSTK